MSDFAPTLAPAFMPSPVIRRMTPADLKVVSEIDKAAFETYYRRRRRLRTIENMNAALRLCRGDFHLLVQDDRPLLKPLDLDASVQLLETHPDAAMIRYAWPQGRDTITGQHRSKLMTHPDGWRRFCTGWIYGDEPHLRQRSFMDRYGWYLEDVRHGASEGDMLHRLRRRQATIVAADDIYFGHNGADVPAVINDTRLQGRNR